MKNKKEIYYRKKKLEEMRKNENIFPNNFRQNTTIKNIKKNYKKNDKEYFKNNKIIISIAGRIISIRVMGKSSFLEIRNIESKIQIYISENNISKNKYKKIIKQLDIGDIIGVLGVLFKTNTEELSVKCKKLYVLTKSVKPFPNKFQGLLNQEICYRKRYLDLITNKKSRNTFKTRSIIINNIRKFMIKENFVEVETPMMHNIPGGGLSKPFITHHSSLNIDLYLRIAPELYLKQLIVGGFEKIFEINRNFRNEGLSSNHNPEFTMMEFYVAYIDYEDLMKIVENLLNYIVDKIFNKNKINYNNFMINFEKPFKKISMQDSICEYCKNVTQSDISDIKIITDIAKSFNITVEKNWGVGKLQEKIFSEKVEKNLIQPTFVIDYPTEISPLARAKKNNKLITDRFELFVCGNEIGNGFSELNDPKEQKNRFLEQLKNKTLEEQNIFYDKDYITSLEYGLPPTAGCGIGIDRLVMILTNNYSIKDVILFPTLRNANK
ncbi:lysS [Wigglesworthia glossinidia endosymbiont of Glossina brevipalpis]|uniref:Lysine--tRNA ligase n=1 Tax=Wigglesworthia glossinidia brevipalpis TaxID=36870 RepID=SYK_WIGBR|nr:RecName: Full=Lysine--tRNA ligase; AltName: Full=Lysyl-tRNA synthetase; Short=LysRS [Wigglesworthia glossinidia endosymbiont of Glossina brevipalpis]BAC24587.1 lysS [Wigglesworthia glossinidia endosymbiont of Glossina brevipalpis]